uniref:Anaphase-promoting complex subunit 4 WD40 domain-containing protein n=1 Tax=Aureoumbra lagunensis TaxID=44058 RepID=A0A7S3JVN2_9STRA|mmetsp:Transcript_2905/g.4540  ORF Transcript_2905/g.4540 Transcript_2905/m.4540 type:complete len:296 (+) Transcript_2905:682-1569(+)|eukprot:CAMPEP_0197305774 /NCGR_PEP_ID=MMETSP0891-20130614/2150_1 /TAXON_ID=44058 ORGANISM="Aureoumbra lagunensis, Strain CCMP1510" /NCGR_SAMPLE_ID=MMETSP0891 /ASSEMBLY_ACC=CAM_ASM_000534 /LENGTH=295 /DNA_ID=CAMNT_0042787249 /DNA_START=938 /DNA_END=1825 /DNA_ORIENTATION=+
MNEILALQGHQEAVIAICGEETILASASRDKTLRIWDCQTGDCIQVIKCESTILSLSLSNGKVAGGGIDYIARVWNVENGEQMCIFVGHKGWIRGVVLRPDGTLITASQDKTARLWSATGEMIDMQKHTDEVFAICGFADGRVATGSGDATVRIFEGSSLDRALHFHDKAVISLAQPSASTLCSGAEDNTVVLWNLVAPMSNAILAVIDLENVATVAIASRFPYLAAGNELYNIATTPPTMIATLPVSPAALAFLETRKKEEETNNRDHNHTTSWFLAVATTGKNRSTPRLWQLH